MKKILFITGSINQTTQMHQIANELPEFDCWFSQLFTDNTTLNTIINKTTLLSGTVLSTKFRLISEEYLQKHALQIDFRAQKNKYDLVVFCTDLIVPPRMRNIKTIWVQEGMIDRYTPWSSVVKALKLPPTLCGNTSLNGSSNICDVYCAASEGYKQYFTGKGTSERKIVVTGMPNYDNLVQHVNNDFPNHNYVMVATTDMRETFRIENRIAFIKKAVKIADGRPLLFKLHPNENVERAEKEIYANTPAGTLVYSKGNTNHMIANCCELITQYSTVVYTGIALGKKVHSLFDVNELKRLAPIQNDGVSARNIAAICRGFLNHDGDKKSFDPHAAMDKYQVNKPETQLTEELIANW
ncbi:UDP-N-acetyl glucosamine 2-epimerase [Mucilaginibacter rubeus]|uniref:UDP-N-acetyl glucosamine 2-epimerase n=1 Tax=Mucilaginibacter rubeus TaxID=2027860 RepID=A0AAE6JCJ4_9SPHI|nr:MULTISPECIES: hypothetical protein [Mucilaginibacter]QEM03209.1 UDP-N-acetyl glucosamine 2-epimerase [Mucilaginibacter rubeus]QEM15828.1 UDP-N-acetyl glucosamine 2-epimerase [Mucilaginibacter gossypii]QTE41434.1 hypothetical protein J3L19_21075 [Mucilaginibacter rubeus]QTE48037.1 hypothetical protein J3L21_21060 [Mucilaginibacter rubeus]QTE59431.1 hypothetical protein J3L23_12730 [Mucilaginibacter rubeus]